MTKTDEQEAAAEAADKKKMTVHQGTRTGGGHITRLQVNTFGELISLADHLAKSDIVPKDMIGKSANILLALMFGNEVGLTPAQALQNVMVVNGRPTLWGDAVMGLVENSNLQEFWKDEYLPEFEGGAFRFTTQRVGRDPVIRIFSMADARAAKLTEKDGPWKTYPKRMLFHRARSWALRDTYPDVLKGIRYYEEERDVIETTAVREPKAYAMPGQPKPEPKTEAPATPPTQPPQTPAGESAKAEGETEGVIKVGGGAATELDGAACFVIRDDAETPKKYYHGNKDWNEMAKVAKGVGGYLAVRWVEKTAKKGTVLWLTAVSLKS